MSNRLLSPLLAILVVFAVWEILVAAFGFAPQILPGPYRILTTLWQARAPLFDHTKVTLIRTLLGFSLGMLLGVALGLVLGYWRVVNDALNPLITAFYCLPKAAVVPIFLLWAGLGTPPAILTSLSMAFFPVFVNVLTGLFIIDPDLSDLLMTFGGRKMQIFLKVGLPSSLPYFFASLRVAGPTALVGVVIAEMIAASNGLGYVMLLAGSSFNTPLMFATVIMMAILGGFIYLACSYAGRTFVWWAYRTN